MPIIILAVLVIAAWIDLGRRLHRFERQIMSRADDILAAQQAAVDALTEIDTDLDTLIALAQQGTQGGLTPEQAQVVLDKATALRDGLQAAAAKFTPPPAA
jgi:hypothetical protein